MMVNTVSTLLNGKTVLVSRMTHSMNDVSLFPKHVSNREKGQNKFNKKKAD